MFIGPKPRAPASKTKTGLISVLILLLIYFVWIQHDKLNLEVVSTATGSILAGAYGGGEGQDAQPQAMNETLAGEEEDNTGVAGIPKKIWYKLGPKGLSEEMKEWTASCIDQNPDYQAAFLTDELAEDYVKQTFSAARPDIVDVYTQLTIPILKADLLRYLLLYTEGGIWSDLDVSCEPGIPISDWISEPYRSFNPSSPPFVDMVVGYEFDAGFSDYYFHEFATWTILSKPGVRHMLVVIDDIIDAVNFALVSNKVSHISDLTTAMVGDIVDFTGPRRFTRSVMKSLVETLGYQIDRHDVENILEPILLDNVLILPGNAFANATNHFEDLGESSVPVMVTHHYAGSWKNEFGGEKANEEEAVANAREESGDESEDESDSEDMSDMKKRKIRRHLSWYI